MSEDLGGSSDLRPSGCVRTRRGLGGSAQPGWSLARAGARDSYVGAGAGPLPRAWVTGARHGSCWSGGPRSAGRGALAAAVTVRRGRATGAHHLDPWSPDADARELVAEPTRQLPDPGFAGTVTGSDPDLPSAEPITAAGLGPRPGRAGCSSSYRSEGASSEQADATCAEVIYLISPAGGSLSAGRARHRDSRVVVVAWRPQQTSALVCRNRPARPTTAMTSGRGSTWSRVCLTADRGRRGAPILGDDAACLTVVSTSASAPTQARCTAPWMPRALSPCSPVVDVHQRSTRRSAQYPERSCGSRLTCYDDDSVLV